MRSPSVDQTGTRKITGRVNTDGTTIVGTGFVSTRNAVGTYTVRLVIPVRAILSVVLTLASPGYLIQVSSITNSDFGVWANTLSAGAATPVDTSFWFEATVLPR